MPHFQSIATAVLLGCLPLAAGTQTVVPREDPDVTLHNPDMGWVMYENYPLDPRPNGSSSMLTLPNENFQGCDHVAVMFAWSDVETAEGRYDWSRVDTAWDYWLQRGKSLHLRMSTEPLFGWSRLQPAGGLGIPDWLLARIPDKQKNLRTDNEGKSGWHVDARNPLYQDRLRIFLKATQAHLSGKRRPALIDLRGFGRWGEWHSGFPYASQEDKREALKAVLAIWSEAFPGQMLALSYSYDPDGPPELHAGSTRELDPACTRNFADYLRFSAFDVALEKTNITLRRDGAGGAVSSNQRKLCEYAYHDLRRAPQMSEFVGGYAQTRPGGTVHLQWSIDDALSLHPNYVNLLGYGARDGLNFMLERPDLVIHGLHGMGYRLVPLQAILPETIQPGEKFVLHMQWSNRAAGRALRDYALKVRLATDKGRQVAAEVDAGVLPTSQWLQGDKHSTRTEVIFPKIDGSGQATLQISLNDPASGRVISLPLSARGSDGFYTLGVVTLGPATNASGSAYQIQSPIRPQLKIPLP